jgi:hypothetical protein
MFTPIASLPDRNGGIGVEIKSVKSSRTLVARMADVMVAFAWEDVWRFNEIPYKPKIQWNGTLLNLLESIEVP